jgi:hypothetical protein
VRTLHNHSNHSSRSNHSSHSSRSNHSNHSNSNINSNINNSRNKEQLCILEQGRKPLRLFILQVHRKGKGKHKHNTRRRNSSSSSSNSNNSNMDSSSSNIHNNQLLLHFQVQRLLQQVPQHRPEALHKRRLRHSGLLTLHSSSNSTVLFNFV